jgi:hypothetical protein
MSKTFSNKNRQELRRQFSSTFFLVLLRFRVFLSKGSSKTQQQKNRTEKFSPKNRKKTNFPRFLSRFWAFFDEGSSKTPQQVLEQ